MLRPFKTDYAGAFSGFCKSRESAIQAATKHILIDGYTKATITDTRSNEDVAFVRLDDTRTKVTIITVRKIRKIGL